MAIFFQMGELVVSVNRKIAEALGKLTFEHRETNYHHHSYEEDLYQYELLKQGNPKALDVSKALFQGPTTGSVSNDPVRNYQFLFVASITLACRFCIEGGMLSEEAFNLSDLYIRQVDACNTVEEVFSLHGTMFRDFLARMRSIQRRRAVSRPVYQCLEYIEDHMQQPLTVRQLARNLGISESYLSTLFKKEIGVAVSEYIRRKRIDEAKKLLQYTEFSCTEIAEYLCFSSDCHFSQLFKQYVGMTPREYRKKNSHRHWEGASGEAAHSMTT